MSNDRSKKMADLIDKMCRKISQLTRVVYILNTKMMNMKVSLMQ